VTAARWAVGLIGCAVAAYGGWLLSSRGHDPSDVAIWLVAGVVLHDGVVAVVTVGLGLLAVRIVPVAARAPVAVGFVVLGSVTLLAVPVLGRFGARADNATLLDRNYTAGWVLVVGAIVVVVGVSTLVRSRRGSEVRNGSRPGGGRRQDRG
jgi:hypothetical protein